MKKPIIYSADELHLMEHKLGRKIRDITKEELEEIKKDKDNVIKHK